MPVYFFALSCIDNINWLRALLIFILLHFFLYPASNGYNSFMDKDKGSIGAIAKPMQPTKQLFYTTIVMDIFASVLSFFISTIFAAAFIFYILCSRLYSYRGIRLKRFALLGFIIVVINQGALIFAMVYYGASSIFFINMPFLCIAAATFLIGGFYPITQVYQHDADKKDGVKTISMLLGKKGTFIFCAIMYTIAFALLFYYFYSIHLLKDFILLQLFFIPVIAVFIKWVIEIYKNEAAANFKQTMRMNIVAATCTNLAFITLLIIHQFG